MPFNTLKVSHVSGQYYIEVIPCVSKTCFKNIREPKNLKCALPWSIKCLCGFDIIQTHASTCVFQLLELPSCTFADFFF